jgi:hypothetical protein
LVDVLKLDVAEGNISDMALAGIRLDPGRIGTMNCSDIFENDVVNGLGDVRGVAHGSDDHGTGFVAGCVFDIDVLTVAFDGYAVLRSCKKMEYRRGQ